MVTGLNYNDISTEVRAEEEAEGATHIGPLRLAPGERQLGELLIRVQHHKVRAKRHSAGGAF